MGGLDHRERGMSKHSIGRCQVSFVAALLVAALLAAAPLAAAQAQDRDLDREPSLGKVFTGETVEGGGPARFMLTLEAGQALDLTAAPVGGSDPFIRVYEAGSDTL